MNRFWRLSPISSILEIVTNDGRSGSWMRRDRRSVDGQTSLNLFWNRITIQESFSIGIRGVFVPSLQDSTMVTNSPTRCRFDENHNGFCLHHLR
jgi:hypothetical protein